ncbi:MAG: hypothetical protein P4K98_05505 [Bryobacteraceae bacterium]|nr:hypothetical protein [Bryobacteraceae bacterium]
MQFLPYWAIDGVPIPNTNIASKLDNSQTFGGTHYAEPRQIYAQIRYRFHW